MTQLKTALETFSEKVNQHQEVTKMLAGWDRNLHIEAADTGEKYCLVTDNQQTRMSEELAEPRHALLVGQSDTLVGVFTGQCSPAKEYTAGRLRFKGGIKDEMKLDTIVEVLWK